MSQFVIALITFFGVGITNPDVQNDVKQESATTIDVSGGNDVGTRGDGDGESKGQTKDGI